jgi:hypothetical protein
MRKVLFEIAILLHPSAEEARTGKSSEVLVMPKYILAQSQEGATLLAAREIPESHLDKLDRIEVAVRPF